MVMRNGKKRRWNVSVESTDSPLEVHVPLNWSDTEFYGLPVEEMHTSLSLFLPSQGRVPHFKFLVQDNFVKIWFYLKEHLGGTEYSPFSFSQPILIVLTSDWSSRFRLLIYNVVMPKLFANFPPFLLSFSFWLLFLFFYSALRQTPKIKY